LLAKKRFAIEMDCLGLIALQQPTDGDLRALTAVLEIVTELEHIGRYLSDIARVHVLVFRLDDIFLDLLAEIRSMATETQELLRQALRAFVERDIDLACAVHARDGRIDAQYQRTYSEVLRFLSGRSRTLIKHARYLGEIARNLERTADRVANICEWVVFAATGMISATGV
jgi:phosphate transport system protein